MTDFPPLSSFEWFSDFNLTKREYAEIHIMAALMSAPGVDTVRQRAERAREAANEIVDPR
jgi:hypothetical protein